VVIFYDVSVSWYHDLASPARTVGLFASLDDALACVHEHQQRGTSDVVSLTPLHVTTSQPSVAPRRRRQHRRDAR